MDKKKTPDPEYSADKILFIHSIVPTNEYPFVTEGRKYGTQFEI